jgi:hypothetical protein
MIASNSRRPTIADAIRARGFRKWYEGRLVESHLHLVTAFLCLIAVLGAIEQGGPYNSFANGAWLLAVTIGLGALCIWSVRRYLVILQLAEFFGDRSHCPACKAYARFTLLHTVPRNELNLPDHLQETPVLVVQCRKCNAGWRM